MADRDAMCIEQLCTFSLNFIRDDFAHFSNNEKKMYIVAIVRRLSTFQHKRVIIKFSLVVGPGTDGLQTNALVAANECFYLRIIMFVGYSNNHLCFRPGRGRNG